MIEFFQETLDKFLHLNDYLNQQAEYMGIWLYLVLFAIVFCETGLVVTPFLPGDSLLFAVGALSANDNSPIAIGSLLIMLIVAAVSGDAMNYMFGYYVGPKVFRSETSWFLNKKHLLRTHNFYETYGGKTIVIARFIPIVRTFAPFVAGVGKMGYSRFSVYNIFGGCLWVVIFLLGGYFLGNQEFAKKNFSYIVLAIILISVMPMVMEFFLAWRRRAAREPIVAIAEPAAVAEPIPAEE